MSVTGSILICDDDAAIRTVVTQALRRDGNGRLPDPYVLSQRERGVGDATLVYWVGYIAACGSVLSAFSMVAYTWSSQSSSKSRGVSLIRKSRRLVIPFRLTERSRSGDAIVIPSFSIKSNLSIASRGHRDAASNS